MSQNTLPQDTAAPKMGPPETVPRSAAPAGPAPSGAVRPAPRRAGPEDTVAVRTLTRAAYAKWVPVIGREPLPMTADHDAAVRNNRVDLLEPEGELAALIEMRSEADHLLIVNLAVRPDRQGRGHGRALLAHAEALARSLGLAETRLYTNGRFVENLRLYERAGYRVVREETSPLGVTVHMSKPLGPRSEPRDAPGSGHS